MTRGKLITLAVTSILLLALFVSPFIIRRVTFKNGRAAGGITLTLSSPKTSYKSGETIPVYVNLSPGTYTPSAARLYLTFPDSLTLNSITPATYLPKILSPAKITSTFGEIALGVSSSSLPSGTAVIATYNFTVKSTTVQSIQVAFDPTRTQAAAVQSTSTSSLASPGSPLSISLNSTTTLPSSTPTRTPTPGAIKTPTPTPVPASSTVTHLQTVSGAASGSSTVSAPSVSAGSNRLYLAAVSIRSFSITVNSVSGLGLTWTRVASQCAARKNQQLEVWKAYGSPSSSGSVTAALTGSAINSVISVSTYSGSGVGNVVKLNTGGVNAGCPGTGTDTSSYSASLPTQSGSLVYSAASIRHAAHTPGSGYTERLERHQGSSGDVAGLAVQDRSNSSSSTPVTGSLSSIIDWAAIALEIRP